MLRNIENKQKGFKRKKKLVLPWRIKAAAVRSSPSPFYSIVAVAKMLEENRDAPSEEQTLTGLSAMAGTKSGAAAH